MILLEPILSKIPEKSTRPAAPPPRTAAYLAEKFSFPPDTNFEKESDNQGFESKTAFGSVFLKQKNSAKLVSG